MFRRVKDEGPELSPEEQKELRRQFWGFVELNDREGYLEWISLQPGFSPASPRSIWRAVDAWKAARAELLANQRRKKERAFALSRKA